MSLFTPARREQMRLRMAIQGPAGGGKTFTAFTLASGLSATGRFAVIDTERRALEYADRFDFLHVAPPVADPAELPKMIADAAANDLGPLVIDSFTHYWSGSGGALDRVDRKADKRAGWSEYRPVENSMMGAILGYPGHVIVTLRVKTDYVTEQDSRGRNQTRRVGLKPDQRDSVDYEFSVIGSMDTDHTLSITKTTCPDLVDRRIEKPGLVLVETLAGWLSQGEPAPDINTYRNRALDPHTTVEELREIHREAKRRNLIDVVLVDEHGDTATLGDILVRLAKERTPQAVAVTA